MANECEYWSTRWDDDNIPFHFPFVAPLLQRNFDKILQGKKNIKIFVPLCGKTLDMKWLYDLGHTVVGVEFSQKGIEDFFQEHNIKHTVTSCEQMDGLRFKSDDDRIRLYQGDLFKFNSELEDSFDGIWDKSSFVAIPMEDRPRYTALMTSLLSPAGIYMLETVDYDSSLKPGNPKPIPEYELYTHFAEKFSIERLEYTDEVADGRKKRWNLPQFFDRLHLLKPKR